jgi:hypothetical protein
VSSWRDPRGRPFLFLLVAALFCFRLAYGLTSDFWTEDERQIYLIGLRAYAHGQWPYFGPDVVWTTSRIPGALQGLLVKAPLSVLSVPESPYVLLNLLSLAALALLAWLVCLRVPELPKPFVWVWLLSAPWTLNYSTHVVNPSYVLFGAALFFAGFLESMPGLRRGALPMPAAFALMGAGLGWVVQLHLSWVLLPPYAAVALAATVPSGARRLLAAAGAFVAALLVVSLTLAPTLLRFGMGGSERNMAFIPLDASAFVTIVARFLSFASLEVQRFIENTNARRLVVLRNQPWLVPFVAVALVASVLQPMALLALGFVRRAPWKDWGALRLTTLATVVWVYLAYCFASTDPRASAFYVVLPLAMVYAFHAWALVWRYRAVRIAWIVVLVTNLVVHAGLAIERASERSLYADRPLVAAAIDRRDDLLLGRRRQDAPTLISRAPDDIEVRRARWRPAVFGWVSEWRVVLRHQGPEAAYLDVAYAARYWDAEGRPLQGATGVIKRILEPGGTYVFWLVDGMAVPGTARAELQITGAEAVKPLPNPVDSGTLPSSIQ